MSTVIGFCGKLGSGKDAAADRLAGHILSPDAFVVRGSFARKLKSSAAACFPGVTVPDWEIWKNDPNVKVLIVKETDPCDREEFPADVLSEQTVREFLQLYGTEGHRDEFGQDFWVEQAFADLPEYDVLIFTDLRFENEARAIKERGGRIVRIRSANESTGSHVSEAGLAEKWIDVEIQNHVRDDNFETLDAELRVALPSLFLPLYMTV